VFPEDERDLHEEGAHGVLEGGDRTVGVREGSPEMCEDLCRGWPARGLSRQLRRRAALCQRGADLALPQVEAFPDALQGSVTEVAVGGADGCADGTGGGELEELPQTDGGQAEASDLVRAPDAEGPSATRSCLAVAAKDPPRAYGFASGIGVVKSVQKAVPNQRADDLAMRTRGQLEPLGNRVPFLGVLVKPSNIAHGTTMKIMILPAWEKSGVKAGYDKKSMSGVRGKIPGMRTMPFAKLSV
jgi:hypothetical protein